MRPLPCVTCAGLACMIVASFANPFGLETECVRNINACLGGVWPSMLLDCGFGFAVLLDTPQPSAPF